MKIAYIMLTNGLEYDDRIRKEMFSMRELLGDVEFKIFGFHGDNHAEAGVLSYGVPYELVSLKNRGGKKDFFSELRKEYDFYSQIKPKVKDYDLLWCCDHQPFFFPLFSDKPVIWDLHEIPASLINSNIKRKLMHRMERRCKWLIHANQERIDYLKKVGALKLSNKNLVLRNYPDNNWLSQGCEEPESYRRFKQWLGDDEYVYIQGINNKGRYPLETLSSIMEAHRIKAVIIGNVSQEIKESISKRYPDADQYLYYSGQVVQSDTASFMAHCKFSMVFYKYNTPNNKYCEPNRMFQCLGMGKPVIVGKNEPMMHTVKKFGNGIVLNSDGGVVADNIAAINQMLDNYSDYFDMAKSSKKNFSWEEQKEVFKMCLMDSK